MSHPGHFAVCFWLFVVACASCQDDNARKLAEAINQNTAAVKALAKAEGK